MLSIQELWYRKIMGHLTEAQGRGGLGYHYNKRFIGGALTERSDWNPSVYDTYSVNSWIPESTVAGFDPYPIGLDEQGNEIYNEYTPEEIDKFIIDRDLKRVDPDAYKMIKKNPEKFNELLKEYYKESVFMPVMIETLKDQLIDVEHIDTTKEEDREILESIDPEFYHKITTDILKIGKLNITFLDAYENNKFPEYPEPEIGAIGIELNYTVLLGKIRKHMPEYYAFITDSMNNDPKLYDIDINAFNLEDFLKVYTTSLEPEYTEIIKNRYFNELYDEANKQGKGLDTERGNKMEDILNEKQGFFKSITKNENNVNNTKDYNSLHYTEEYINAIKSKAVTYFQITEQIDDVKKSTNLIGKDKFNKVNELEDKLLTVKQPDTSYYVVDYIGDRGLYELKCLAFSFIDYKYKPYDIANPAYKKIDIFTTINENGNPVATSLKNFEGGINLVATKIDGYKGMDIIFNRDGDNNVYIDQIKYNGINTLNESKHNYNVIFALKDGFYIYNILDDPNLHIKPDGKAILLNTPRIPSNEKGKFDYIIPIDRLELMKKQDINGPITLPSNKKIIREVNELIKDMPKISKITSMTAPAKKRGRPAYTEAQRKAREEIQEQLDKRINEQYEIDKDFFQKQYAQHGLSLPRGEVTKKETEKFIKGLNKAKKEQEDIDKEFDREQQSYFGIEEPEEPKVSKPKRGRPKKK
jgi:hypothetical protein